MCPLTSMLSLTEPVKMCEKEEEKEKRRRRKKKPNIYYINSESIYHFS